MSLAWYWVVLLLVWALVTLSTRQLCRRIMRRQDYIIQLCRHILGHLEPPQPGDPTRTKP